MSLDATYHRTFLADGPFEPVTCTPGCHRGGNAKNTLDDFQPQFVRRQPANPLMQPPPGYAPLQPFNPAPPPPTAKPKLHYRTQKRRPAYQAVGGQIKPIFIVDKLDQQFAAVATPWEQEYSALVKDGPNRFVPLVDSTYTVVGYVGTVQGTHLIKVKDSPIPSYYYGSMAEYMAAEEVVLVSATVPDGWEAFNPLQPNPIYTVVTDIFGDVQSGEITDTKPGAVATQAPWEVVAELAWDVFEIVSLATGVLAIGRALAVGIVRTIIRRKFVQMVMSRAKAALSRTVGEVLARRVARKAARAAASKAAYNPITGMTTKHHQAFVSAAAESEMVIVVRHTNPKSIPLIEKGCPGKPKNLEFINTSAETGVVMANTPAEVLKTQRLGYYVVNGDGKTASRFVRLGDKEVAETVTVKSPFWRVEKGQVIDPKLHKPVVGDYDLMGVFSPKNPGQNVGLVTKNYGEMATDVTNPLVQKASAAVNKGLDMPRVLHGPQDMYKGFRKGASAYHPDGTVLHFETEEAVKAYYKSVGRETRVGAYPRPSPDTPVVDELAKRRTPKPTGWR
jgi:hypothetical protein